jgi:hypothetical protein
MQARLYKSKLVTYFTHDPAHQLLPFANDDSEFTCDRCLVAALLTVQNRAQVHRKRTDDLVPFSSRRVLPRFVNLRIGSKLLRLPI